MDLINKFSKYDLILQVLIVLLIVVTTNYKYNNNKKWCDVCSSLKCANHLYVLNKINSSHDVRFLLHRGKILKPLIT